MLADIVTVMGKEWKEILTGRGMRSGRLNLLIMIVVFGVLQPLQFGTAMLKSSLTLLAWSWVPPFLVIQVVADSFAGERERHTLETLLASRLPDRAILFGKIAAAVSYGWGLTLVCLLAGLITLNVTAGTGTLLLYPAYLAAGILLFTFFSSGITATAGVLLSLHASSVRQVQQLMGMVWLVLVFGIGYGVRLLLPRTAIVQILAWMAWLTENVRPAGIIAMLGIVLAAVNLFLLALAEARFRRARLILD